MPARRASLSLTPILLGVFAVGTVLSPFHSKIAGATWLVWCLWGLFLRLTPRSGPQPQEHAALPAVHVLAVGCAVTMGLAMLKSGYWNDPFDEVYAYLRLLLAAAASYWILTRALLPRRIHAYVGNTMAAQCAAALVCVGWLMLRHSAGFRDFMPANAIPWAQAVAFALCLLTPMALDTGSASVWQRRAWWLGAACGAIAVLMSASRGAYGVFAWMLLLVALRWRDQHGCWPVRRLTSLAAAACVIVAAVWYAPGDPFRVRMAEHEVVQAEDHAAFNTSMGIRLYLWNMAWKGMQSSPIVGVGQTERMYLIKHAGEELPPAQRSSLVYVRMMGHVHNQYLHAALDGGVIGLGAVLALLLGMGGAAWRLRKVDVVASRQMAGLLFVHAAGSMTNVNFAHTYYVVTIAVAMSLVMLGVRPVPDARP